MSDPFDRLRDALADVPVPDQWPDIEARAAADDTPSRPNVRSGRPLAWWGAAAAALTLVATAAVVLATRQQADAPASPPPGETLPEPDPAMVCRTEADLASVVELINAGVPVLGYGPSPSSAVTELANTVVLDATAATLARSGEFVELTLADVTYHRGDGPVDAVSQRRPAWDDIAVDDPLAAPVDLVGVRVIAGVEPLSSAPVWAPTQGSLFAGCAGTDVPAIEVHNGAPLVGNPSIDDLVELLASGEPAPSVPVTAAPESSMPCTREADVDAIRTLLRSGVVEPSEPPVDAMSGLLERVDVAFRARLTSTTRGGDGTAYLYVSGVDVLVGDDVYLTSIGLPGAWAADAGPDPLAVPVTFDNVDVVVFARYVPGATNNWIPDPQGVFVGCADGSSYVRPVLQPAPFLDHSSLDAMTAGIIAEASPGVGPWGRPCTDRVGTSAAPADDPLAERSFGPLASEPALTVLYPIGPTEPMYSPPTSSILRVPGGLMIRMQSSGPEGADQILAVVDDSGSVRWRRCLFDTYGWSAGVEGDVLRVEFVAADGSNATEWWSFELATGASTVDAAPPAWADRGTDASPSEVAFHVDAGGLPAPLSRRAADGRELWRRDDLLDPSDEGFRASDPQVTHAGEVVLVRACAGPRSPATETGQASCPYALLGIDMADGSTIWQLDGPYSVPLVADGYAIVTPRDGDVWQDPSILIDLATGATVPGGVANTPGAFYEECCGGYDYNRVESTGGVAWSIAFDRLHVWFPAGVSGPGTTVDLLGPATVPTIDARFGMPVWDVPDCGVNCRVVLATGTGFVPGATLAAQCHGDQGGAWAPVGEAQTVVVSPDGSFGIANLCTDGRDDGNVKVVVGEVESNVLVGG